MDIDLNSLTATKSKAEPSSTRHPLGSHDSPKTATAGTRDNGTTYPRIPHEGSSSNLPTYSNKPYQAKKERDTQSPRTQDTSSYVPVFSSFSRIATNPAKCTADSEHSLAAIKPMFYLTSIIRGVRIPALLDSGASENFISTEQCAKLGLRRFKLVGGECFTAASGQNIPCTEFVRVRFTLPGEPTSFSFPTMLKIVPVGQRIILGLPFLSRFNPHIDWAARTVSLRAHKRSYVFQVRPTAPGAYQNAVYFPHDPKPTEQGAPQGNNAEAHHLPFEDLSDSEAEEILRQNDPSHDIFGQPVGPPKPEPPAVPVAPEIEKLLKEFDDIFPAALPPGLPPSRPTDHAIDLVPGATPPRHRIYRVALSERAELEKQINEYLAAGHIERAQSPYGAGVLFAEKKDGTKRLCVDYRGLNAITKKDRYPMPRTDDAIDRMAGSRFFSKIDLRSGFHQILIKPEHRERTAFQVESGSYQFLVMPFGLANAPATFQRTMEMAFDDYRKFVQIYIDDVVIHSKTWEEHLQHLRMVFQRLRDQKLYVKRSKCEFGLTEVEFVGFKVSAQGVSTLESKLATIQAWQSPKDVKEIQRFAGLTNFYQKFVPNYANMMAPLSDLLKKKNPWVWGELQENAFQSIKKSFLKSATLAFPDTTKPYIIHCDASDFATGATLSQESDTGLRLVAARSKKLNPAERNYPAHEKELLALIQALTQWKHYLLGADVQVYTDSTYLKHLSTRDLGNPGRHSRWMSLLGHYNVTIHHIPGTTNTAADALSRDPALISPLLPMPAYEDWTEAYLEDPATKAEFFTEDDELLNPARFYHGHLYRAGDDRIVVPTSKIPFVLAECHDAVMAGHLGVDKTIDLISRKYTFPELRSHVVKHVRECHICQTAKTEHRRARGVVMPLRIPERRWSSIHMDWVLGLPPFPPDKNTYNAILTFTDRATKMVHFVATNKFEKATDTARFFFHHVVRLHGLPRSLICDRDSRFTSTFWRTLMDLCGVSARTTSGFHPQANGQAERTNQSVRQHLRILAQRSPDWPANLDVAEMVHNNSPIAHTHYSPYLCNLGYHPYLLPDAQWETKRADLKDRLAHDVINKMNATWTQAQADLQYAKDRDTAFANKRRTPADFQVNDLVLVRVFPSNREQLNPPGPFAMRWAGPFRVMEIVAENSFRLKFPEATHPRFGRVFNAIELRPYYHSEGTPVPDPIIPPQPLGDVTVEDDFPPEDDNPPTRWWGGHIPNVPISWADAAPPVQPAAAVAPEDPPRESESQYWDRQRQEAMEERLRMLEEQLTPPPAPAQAPAQAPANAPSSSSQLSTLAISRVKSTARFRSRAKTPPHIEAPQNSTPDLTPSESSSIPSPISTPPQSPKSPRRVSFSPLPLHSPADWPHVAIHNGDRNDVMLSPEVFRAARKALSFKPGVDLFATAAHHQLPRYFSPVEDKQAVGIDAFKANWKLEFQPYINPPWPLIPQCIQRIRRDGIRAMMVVPYWPTIGWWKKFEKIVVKYQQWDTPVYLLPTGEIWGKPPWDTIIAIVDGDRYPLQ